MRNGLGTLSALRGRSVIPSEVEGSALAEAFQRRNADLETSMPREGPDPVPVVAAADAVG